MWKWVTAAGGSVSCKRIGQSRILLVHGRRFRVFGIQLRYSLEAVAEERRVELSDLVFLVVSDHTENVEVGDLHPLEHDLVVPDDGILEDGKKGSDVRILSAEDAVE